MKAMTKLMKMPKMMKLTTRNPMSMTKLTTRNPMSMTKLPMTKLPSTLTSLTSLAGALALGAIAGCGAAAHGPAATGAPGTTTRSPSSLTSLNSLSPLALELQVLTVRGRLLARGDTGEWRSLAVGASLAGVRELRAERRGAVVALGHGEAAGKLWLRAGSTVRFGQDEAGVQLVVVNGRARLRRPASALPVFAGVAAANGATARPLEGDLLIEAGFGGLPQLTATGARPELASWALALDRPEEGSGVGRLEAEAIAAPAAGARGAADPEAAMQPLALRKVTVDIQTAGDVAITSIEHVFHNPAEQHREGTFRFPVPDGAMLTGLAMEVGGKLVEGEIVEREKARQIYEKIVDDMQDPALLEWEQGNWFKLRVFPIEARSDKRVIIRYVAPLSRGAAGWEAAFSLATSDGAGVGVGGKAAPIGELTVRLDGKEVLRETQVAAGFDLALPVGDAAVPVVMREVRGDAVYTAVRIGLPAAARASLRQATSGAANAASAASGAATLPAGPRRLAIVVDTSRSALEGKALAIELLKAALAELSPADRFLVLASDVAVTPHAADYVAATPAAIAAALAFLDEIEPDGASDVAAALTAVTARRPGEVLYLGDGIPTWGERGPAALSTLAGALGAPIHAGLIGKGASTALWSELSGRTGGRAVVVRTPADAQRFALTAMHAASVPRLRNVHLEVPAGATLFPAGAASIYEGDELVALLRTPASAPPPTALVLTGEGAAGPVRTSVSLGTPASVAHVAQRWAAYQLDALESAGAARQDIVAVSEEFGLMSRYTSLLVLENDEAFQQHQIARRKAAEQARLAANEAASKAAQATVKTSGEAGDAAPQVTGGDLDTLGTREASLSPGEIQPGDPEIKIPAPRDARSVVVSFPFGETKLAVWDAEAAAWMVRFLIDKQTRDGAYQVRVTITHADGRIEVLTLPYLVDTVAPAFELAAVKVAGGYRLRAQQVASRDGSRRKDADKVEVVLPDGTVLALPMTRWGLFEGVWTTAPLSGERTLRLVVRDRALNQAALELRIDAGGIVRNADGGIVRNADGSIVRNADGLR